MPTTANKGYNTPAYNTLVGTWGTGSGGLNETFQIQDNNLGGVVSVSLSNANVTLSSAQAQNVNVFLSGTLLANVTVSTPCIGFFFVTNNTSGNYSLKLQANFGAGSVGSAIIIPPGVTQLIVSDTTNGVRFGAAPPSVNLPGEIKSYAGSSAPAGWLLCYGQAVNRNLYAALYGVIGTTYGAGDGSTTFNLPDLRGRSIFGLDNMGGSAANRLTGSLTGSITSPTTLGGSGGEEGHANTITETASHGHTITDPQHSHPFSGGAIVYSFGGGTGGGLAVSASTTSPASTGITINNTGGGGAHNTIPPAMVLNVIIKF